MGLGPTLVGAILGAAVGMGLHLGIEMGTGREAPWFVIFTGLLTGLGVRQANRSLTGNVSYLRGAVSAAVALAAIFASTPLISWAMQKKDAKSAKQPIAAASTVEEAVEVDGEDGEVTAAVEVDEPATPVTGVTAAGNAPIGQGNRDLWQAIFMGIGTFIAYEFGRGAAARTAMHPVDEAPVEPQPHGTDPSD